MFKLVNSLWNIKSPFNNIIFIYIYIYIYTHTPLCIVVECKIHYMFHYIKLIKIENTFK